MTITVQEPSSALEPRIPARSDNSTWDFGPVLDLINNLSYDDPESRKYREAENYTERTTRARPVSTPTLGDFSKIWEFLGVPADLPPPEVPAPLVGGVQDSYNSDGALYRPPSSKGVKWKDEKALDDSAEPLEDTDAPQEQVLTKGQKKKIRKKARRAKAEAATANSKNKSLRTQIAHFGPVLTDSESEKKSKLAILSRSSSSKLELSDQDADESDQGLVKLFTPSVKSAMSDDESSKRPPSSRANTPARKASLHTLMPETPTPTNSRYPLRSRSAINDVSRHSQERDIVNVSPFKILKILPPKGSKSKQKPTSSQQPQVLPPSTEPVGSVQTVQLQTPSKELIPEAVPVSAPPAALRTQSYQSNLPHSQFSGVSSRPQYTLNAPQLLPTQVAHVASPAVPVTNRNPSFLANNPTSGSGSSLQPGHQSSLLPASPSFRKNALTIRHGEDRHYHLFLTLINHFGADRKWLVSPMQLSNNRTSKEGIHIFVDASNIFIGFADHLKRVQGLHPKARLQLPDISFDSLVLLMERRRPAAKRVLVGSSPLQPAFETAKAVGYEVCILDKVFKAKELTERQKFFREVDTIGWHRAIRRHSHSGAEADESSSDSETITANGQPAVSPQKWVEQGVDEILHLKILESIVDADEPSTIVLATGDAAEAEYSQGFLAMVERALKKGWKVELISWSKNISQAYRKNAFQRKWKDRFKIIPLDEYAEDLLDT